MRALFVSAGNPVLSVPNGEELEAAIGQLDLCVSIDFYVSDTGRLADFVLPATTMYEREDFPLPFLGLFTTPYINMTDAVLEPAGEARQEWEIIEQISRRIGITPSSVGIARLLGKAGIRLSPQRLVDLILRTGPRGDLFGLRRGGLSVAKLRENPHGIVLDDNLRAGVMPKKIRHRDRRVHLDVPEIRAEAERLASQNGHDPDFPLRLIGLRELRSHNSWMHNSQLLMRGDREHAARINPADAAAAGIEDGASCRITSPHGAIELTARLTDEVGRGTVAVPHGWGHRGGWRTAVAAGGANVNLLASSEPSDLERLAGMAFLNGIPVRLEAVTQSAEPAAAEPAAVAG
jgi:formate dehydrogenase